MNILFLMLSSLSAFASGENHSHGHGGEIEHLYPIIAIFIILIIAGIAAGYFLNKKK